MLSSGRNSWVVPEPTLNPGEGGWVKKTFWNRLWVIRCAWLMIFRKRTKLTRVSTHFVRDDRYPLYSEISCLSRPVVCQYTWSLLISVKMTISVSVRFSLTQILQWIQYQFIGRDYLPTHTFPWVWINFDDCATYQPGLIMSVSKLRETAKSDSRTDQIGKILYYQNIQ